MLHAMRFDAGAWLGFPSALPSSYPRVRRSPTTHVVYPSGNASVTLGYDALNRLANMMDGIGTTKYSCAMLGNGLSTMTEETLVPVTRQLVNPTSCKQ
jgi:hypothetical protein